MSEKEVYDRLRVSEEAKRRAKAGELLSEKLRVRQVNESLPFFLDGKALETVSKVLEMVGEKLETKEQLTEFRRALGDMQSSVESAVKSGEEVANILRGIETKQNTLNNAFKQYIEKNEKAVDGVLQYLKDWS